MSDSIDKIYDLLEKMYSDLSYKIDDARKELKTEIRQTGNNVMLLENEFKDKFGAVKDELSIVRGDIAEIKVDVAEIKDRIDRHGLKIQLIEGGKKSKKAK